MSLLNMVALYGLAEAMRLLSRSACESGSDYSLNRDMQGRHMDYLQDFAFFIWIQSVCHRNNSSIDCLCNFTGGCPMLKILKSITRTFKMLLRCVQAVNIQSKQWGVPVVLYVICRYQMELPASIGFWKGERCDSALNYHGKNRTLVSLVMCGGSNHYTTAEGER